MAWPAVVSNLKSYEIIEVHVQPELYVEHVDGPPGYQIAVGVPESEETELFKHSTLSRTSGAKPTNTKHPTGRGGLRLK